MSMAVLSRRPQTHFYRCRTTYTDPYELALSVKTQRQFDSLKLYRFLDPFRHAVNGI